MEKIYYYKIIQDILKQRKIKNSEFAKKLGITHQALNHYFKDREPPLEILKLTSLLLQISIDEILFNLPDFRSK